VCQNLAVQRHDDYQELVNELIARNYSQPGQRLQWFFAVDYYHQVIEFTPARLDAPEGKWRGVCRITLAGGDWHRWENPKPFQSLILDGQAAAS